MIMHAVGIWNTLKSLSPVIILSAKNESTIYVLKIPEYLGNYLVT